MGESFAQAASFIYEKDGSSIYSFSLDVRKLKIKNLDESVFDNNARLKKIIRMHKLRKISFRRDAKMPFKAIWQGMKT